MPGLFMRLKERGEGEVVVAVFSTIRLIDENENSANVFILGSIFPIRTMLHTYVPLSLS